MTKPKVRLAFINTGFATSRPGINRQVAWEWGNLSAGKTQAGSDAEPPPFSYCDMCKVVPILSTKAQQPLGYEMNPTSPCLLGRRTLLLWAIPGGFVSTAQLVEPSSSGRSWWDPGTLKSPALDLALHNPQGPMRRSGRSKKRCQTDKAAFDADLAEWKKKGARRPRTSHPRNPRSR